LCSVRRRPLRKKKEVTQVLKDVAALRKKSRPEKKKEGGELPTAEVCLD